MEKKPQFSYFWDAILVFESQVVLSLLLFFQDLRLAVLIKLFLQKRVYTHRQVQIVVKEGILILR